MDMLLRIQYWYIYTAVALLTTLREKQKFVTLQLKTIDVLETRLYFQKLVCSFKFIQMRSVSWKIQCIKCISNWNFNYADDSTRVQSYEPSSIINLWETWIPQINAYLFFLSRTHPQTLLVTSNTK